MDLGQEGHKWAEPNPKRKGLAVSNQGHQIALKGVFGWDGEGVGPI